MPRRDLRLGWTRGAIAAVAACLATGASAEPEAADAPPAWDRVANIKGAAERIGRIHRTRGATAAYAQIENCYKTHSLASTYGEGFEACLAQDYLETRTLIQVYGRMPPEALKKAGVPSPKDLADSMGKRISVAFTHYKKTQAFADEVKRLVDEHGLPVFLSIVFPEAARAIENKKAQEKK